MKEKDPEGTHVASGINLNKERKKMEGCM